jgi:hypothetical protein
MPEDQRLLLGYKRSNGSHIHLVATSDIDKTPNMFTFVGSTQPSNSDDTSARVTDEQVNLVAVFLGEIRDYNAHIFYVVG